MTELRCVHNYLIFEINILLKSREFRAVLKQFTVLQVTTSRGSLFHTDTMRHEKKFLVQSYIGAIFGSSLNGCPLVLCFPTGSAAKKWSNGKSIRLCTNLNVNIRSVFILRSSSDSSLNRTSLS